MARVIVPAALKVIVSAPATEFALVIAARSEPAPVSLKLVTTIVAASAGCARGAKVASSASAASRQVRRKASDTALLLIFLYGVRRVV